MVHNTLVDNRTLTDEKELKRISSLEQRVVEVENTLLRKATVALEKRVAELEAFLRESNEECDKLRKTIVDLEENARKNVVVIPAPKEENSFEGDDLTSEGSDEKDSASESSEEQESNLEISDVLSVSFDDKEAETIYGRILKLVENMKSDCTKAINLKIPTMSQLPKFPMRQSSKPTTTTTTSPNTPTPTSTPIPTTTPTSTPTPSPQSRMPGRSRAPSISGILTSSRPVTPSSGHQVTSNISNSPTRMLTPSRVPSIPSLPSLPSLNGLNGSHVSSRPSTPSSVNSISSVSSHGSPVTSHLLRRQSSSISRPRTPNWPPSCNNASGTKSPPLSKSTSIPIPMHIPMRNAA